jgi:hypothetical protein
MLQEIRKALKDIKADYKKIGTVRQADKRLCYKRIVKNLLWGIYGAITAPFIYPIWYIWRKSITDKIHRGTSWEEIEKHIHKAEISEVEKKLKANGKFLFWLWTYGDCNDPYGWGGMPIDYGTKKNNFINRFRWSALRNPRFNINYMYFGTGIIEQQIDIINTLNWQYWHKSYGISSNPDGIIFKWVRDNNNKWYFIYEINNSKRIFYFGYVGLYKHEGGAIGYRGRFETSYRKTDGSYTGDWKP